MGRPADGAERSQLAGTLLVLADAIQGPHGRDAAALADRGRRSADRRVALHDRGARERSRARARTELLPSHPATLSRAVTTAMAEYKDWQLADDLTVGEGFHRLYGEVRAPTAAEAVAVGKLVRVDAVVRGELKVFDERIGTELAAKRPAHVIFAIELVRVSDGVSVWQGEYAEQQQSLSDNLWNLPGFVRQGGTWVRAGERRARRGRDRRPPAHRPLRPAAEEDVDEAEALTAVRVGSLRQQRSDHASAGSGAASAAFDRRVSRRAASRTPPPPQGARPRCPRR